MGVDYLEMFPSEGHFAISVKFDRKGPTIAQRRASIGHLSELLHLIDSSPQSVITFDDHPGVVTAIKIDVIRRNVSISVSLQDTP